MKFRSKNPNYTRRFRGRTIAFENGEYETDDPREIRALTGAAGVQVADTKAELVEEAEKLDVSVSTRDRKDDVVDAVVEEKERREPPRTPGGITHTA